MNPWMIALLVVLTFVFGFWTGSYLQFLGMVKTMEQEGYKLVLNNKKKFGEGRLRVYNMKAMEELAIAIEKAVKEGEDATADDPSV